MRITTLPGYLPYEGDPLLGTLIKQNAIEVVGKEGWRDLGHQTGSTDMGDLSQIMPAVHPYAGGATGNGHGADFTIVDRDAAYVNPAKMMAMTVIDLLAGEASMARRVLAETPPKMSKEAYLSLARQMDNVKEYEEV